jgi:hypothetical protein
MLESLGFKESTNSRICFVWSTSQSNYLAPLVCDSMLALFSLILIFSSDMSLLPAVCSGASMRSCDINLRQIICQAHFRGIWPHMRSTRILKPSVLQHAVSKKAVIIEQSNHKGTHQSCATEDRLFGLLDCKTFRRSALPNFQIRATSLYRRSRLISPTSRDCIEVAGSEKRVRNHGQHRRSINRFWKGPDILPPASVHRQRGTCAALSIT